MILYLYVAGDDYETTTQTLLFTPRQTIIRVSVPIVRDNTAEPTEQFFGDLSNPMGRVTIFQPTATVEITDDDREFGYLLMRMNTEYY